MSGDFNAPLDVYRNICNGSVFTGYTRISVADSRRSTVERFRIAEASPTSKIRYS
jgi:hypothetical protein